MEETGITGSNFFLYSVITVFSFCHHYGLFLKYFLTAFHCLSSSLAFICGSLSVCFHSLPFCLLPSLPLCLFPSRYLSLALALPVPRSPLFLRPLFFIVLSVSLSIHQCPSHFLRAQHARTTKQDKFTNMILKSASERREQRRNASTEPLVVGSLAPLPASLLPSAPPSLPSHT